MITFIALATSVLLWSSVLKLTKKFNSTSFQPQTRGLHQERWRKDLKRVIYIGKIILTLVDQRTWTVKINLHTFGRRFIDLWECLWGCGELLQLSSDTCWTCESVLGELEGMTLLNSCLVLKSWPWCCGAFNWLINWTGSWPCRP